jgi:hypothetical protein
MKKLIILFLLLVFVEKIAAQKDGTASYNDCLLKARFMEGDWMPNPQTPFPKIFSTRSGSSLKKNILLENKLMEIRKILFDAYPKPLATHIMYTLWDVGKMRKNGPNGEALHTMIAPLKCQDDGSVGKKFTEAMAYNQISIYVNSMENIIREETQLTAVIDTNKIKKLTKVFVSPPHDNYDEAYKWEKKLQKPNGKFGNAADKFVVYRDVALDAEGYERHNETVLITKDRKIPFAPIKRGEFLILLELYIQKGITESDKILKGNPNDYNFDLIKSNKISYNKQLEGIAYLRNLYKDSLDKPARVLPEYGYFSKIIDNNLIAEKNEGGIKPIFAEGNQKHCTYYRAANFFKSDKEEDIQMICVNWEYTRYVGTDPEKIKYPHISYGLDNAMQNKFDWDALANILMK